MGLSSSSSEKTLNIMMGYNKLDYVRVNQRLTGNSCRRFPVVTAHSCLRRITPTTNGSVQPARPPAQNKKFGLPVKSGRPPAESKQSEGPPVKVVQLKE